MNLSYRHIPIYELINNYCFALEVYYEWSGDSELSDMSFTQITRLLSSKEALYKLIEPVSYLLESKEYHRIFILKQGVWNYLSKKKNARLALACHRFMNYDIYPGLNV